MTESKSEFFGPLNFEEAPPFALSQEDQQVVCLLCEDSFNLRLALDIFVRHLFETHSLVVEEIQNIHNLPEYLTFWRNKFRDSPLEQIIPSIDVRGGGSCPNQRYYLISSLIKEDEELRHRLRLDYVLNVQEFERTDSGYSRECLFCRTVFEGTRCDFLLHLSTKHNFYLGNPQNLVYIEELIDRVDSKLKDLRCLYCDKTFPDRNILKEHMRKKLHKRISEQNSDYDKYFIVNYLESGKTWKNLQKEHDVFSPLIDGECNNDEEYSDWSEKGDSITCLFCPKKETQINVLCLHMEADHEFDFADLTKNYDFYQKVKLVNYIRKKIHDNCCVFCDFKAENVDILRDHLLEKSHCKIPEDKTFEQPEFYFPTYENDAFLYLIDDIED